MQTVGEKMSNYHLMSDATPLSQVNKLELGLRQLRKTVERKLGKKEDPSIVKVIYKLADLCLVWNWLKVPTRKFSLKLNFSKLKSLTLFVESLLNNRNNSLK